MEAASADLSWKAIDRYSKDYIELQTKDKVKFYKTPDAILQKQLDVFDEVAAKKAAENPLFKEVLESQRAFAERTVAWDHGHQRQPAHGLQPLLRQEGGPGEEELSGLTASQRSAIRALLESGWLISA